MYSSSSAMAAKRFRAWKKHCLDMVSRAAGCPERDFEWLIPMFNLPPGSREEVRTTNVERCFREARRRLKVMGNFAYSCPRDRIIYAIFNYFNTKWTRKQARITEVLEIQQSATWSSSIRNLTLPLTLPTGRAAH